jgi:uracil-DNA glycosylase family 4
VHARASRAAVDANGLEALCEQVIACRSCPRLVAHRETVARVKRRQFRGESYWGRPLSGFGVPAARLLIVGLAPAAHGGNRTGRMFTGDDSGRWLFRALHAAGFANQPTSVDCGDGLVLRDAWVTAAVRCAPPDNRPTPDERARCRPYLVRERALLASVRVIVALGRIAFEAVLAAERDRGVVLPRPLPCFGHGATAVLGDVTLVCSYHPSRQNTQTGKLSRAMLDGVFRRARVLVSASTPVPGAAAGRRRRRRASRESAGRR